MKPLIEADCAIQHEGRTYRSGGAVVTGDYAIAYLSDADKLTDWHGNKIGTYCMVSSWPIRSYLTDTMYQVEAVIDGRTYTGRSCGLGMIWRGRAKAVKTTAVHS